MNVATTPARNGSDRRPPLRTRTSRDGARSGGRSTGVGSGGGKIIGSDLLRSGGSVAWRRRVPSGRGAPFGKMDAGRENFLNVQGRDARTSVPVARWFVEMGAGDATSGGELQPSLRRTRDPTLLPQLAAGETPPVRPQPCDGSTRLMSARVLPSVSSKNAIQTSRSGRRAIRWGLSRNFTPLDVSRWCIA